jgi:hypothetical protein
MYINLIISFLQRILSRKPILCIACFSEIEFSGQANISQTEIMWRRLRSVNMEVW